MKNSLVGVLSLSLSLCACGKKEEAPAAAKKPEAVADKAPAPAEAPVAEKELPVPAEAPPPENAGPDLSAVHAEIKAGKKLQAVKLYRDLNGKLALNASKLGVEVEMKKLGMPSNIDVHQLYFEGKTDEALKALAALYGKPVDDEGMQRMWADIEKMGEASEENLKAKAAAGESTAALAIYHHLHPETPIPEAWAALQGMMPAK